MARVSGLISGLDTDSLIQELVSAYETKKSTYVKKQTKQGWKQDAWKSLNTKVYSFYTGTLRNAQYSTNYTAKKATISDSTKATVSASGNAVEGTQTLKVKQLAKTAYLTGGQMTAADGKSLTANSKLGELSGLSGFSDGTIKVNADGKESEINLTSDMTMNQFVVKLKEAGLNANFDSANQRLFISAKSSGADKEFSITAGNAGGMNALTSLGMDAASSSDVSQYIDSATMNVQEKTDTAYMQYMLKTANADLNTQLSGLQDQYKYVTDESYRNSKNTAWTDEIKSYEDKNKTLDDLNKDILAYTGVDDADTAASLSKIEDFVTKNSDGTYTYKDAYLKDTKDADGNTVKVLDEDKLKTALKDTKLDVDTVKSKVTELNANISQMKSNEASIKSTKETQDLYQAAYSNDKTGATLQKKIDSITAEIAENNALLGEKTVNFTDSSKNFAAYSYTDANGSTQTTDLQAKLAKYATAYGNSTDGNVETKTVNGITVVKSTYENYNNTYKAEQEAAANKLGKTAGELNAMTPQEKKDFIADYVKKHSSSTGAVRVEGSDAEIELNGATFNSNTNNFAINGLTITATGLTKDDEEVTINTATDIDGMYKSIKNLISGYNSILKEMNTLYYADSSKGYEPLTDDEKDAMTDTEIEKWEKKIKDSLLRRDDTLSGIMSTVKNSMAKSYTIGDKTYSLSSFGIATAGYFSVDNKEQGLYHIDGDPDDSTTSGKTDKLKAALAEDPDSVVSFFQKVSNDMYDALTKKMARTSLKSSYTLYNDKEMQKQYDEYGDTIDKWDEKIENYTQKYVKQFSAMETALAKLQSSTSQLSSILGS